VVRGEGGWIDGRRLWKGSCGSRLWTGGAGRLSVNPSIGFGGELTFIKETSESAGTLPPWRLDSRDSRLRVSSFV
jgi:hypothetical protein